MTAYSVPAALRPGGWALEQTLSTRDGKLVAAASGPVTRLSGWAVPGMPNAHSHAFQRAMAGAAEHLDPTRPADSFWTWRDAMYRLANRIGPEEMEAVATQLYAEMLEAGFTAVAEFHYLHHDRDGVPYADPAEMSRALLRAAATAGIRITLLPVFYAHGGFGQPLGADQRRFGHARVEDFARLLDAARRALGPGQQLGLAAHSLRAVSPSELAELAALPGPIHIHIAEQPAEVAQCEASLGARPVAWLLDNLPVDGRWSLVHATHTTPAEVAAAAAAGATAVICPTTEANLGDGVFDLPTLLAANGHLAIGSDSHISVDPREELRLLEYGQRLTLLRRNVAASPTQPSTGQRLWCAAAAGGAQSLGAPLGALADGCAADFVTLDPEHPRMLGHGPGSALDALVFSASASAPVADVVVAGVRVVEEGRHVRRSEIAARFRAAMKRLQEQA